MTPEEIAALQAENARLKDEAAKSQQLVKSLQDEITDQERATAPAAQASIVTELPTVTVNKKKLKFIFPRFNYKGVEYTAAQAAKDNTLLEALVKIGFGGLVEVA